MNEPENFELSEDQEEIPEEAPLRPRLVGAPLSTGASRRVVHTPQESLAKQIPAPAPEKSLESDQPAAEESSSVQRAANFLRAVIPLVQRLLPLLDGNITATVGNLLAPHAEPRREAPAPPPVKLDLVPLEDGLAELRSQQHGLRNQVTEQNASLKRVEDQLEMVREATDRNTLEQQELLEDLKAFGAKIKVVVILALALTALGFLMTLVLYLHMQKMLP